MNTTHNTVGKIAQSRPDLSDYLIHFTKRADGLKTLWKILDEKMLRCNDVICFTEAPLLFLPNMFDIFMHYHDPLFSPNGIAIKKSTLYELGTRPVWYTDEATKMSLPEELRWHCVELDLSPAHYKDYMWQREWRINQSTLNLTDLDFFIITETDKDYGDLQNIDVEVGGEPADGGYEMTANVVQSRDFKGISMESIKNHAVESKEALEEYINKQILGEQIGGGYYSSWS